ncbi:MAG: hypothetical protein U5L96_22190 [Owenweeksia sp.]|nr:hypothetical protein [Owenweeksia sp.]
MFEIEIKAGWFLIFKIGKWPLTVISYHLPAASSQLLPITLFITHRQHAQFSTWPRLFKFG